MSVYIDAIIKHELTVEQIVALPTILSESAYDKFKGDWFWYDPATDANFIKWLWSLSMDESLKQAGAAATLISNSQYHISFSNAETICLTGLKEGLFERDQSARNEFQRCAQNLYKLVKGTEIFYVSDTLVDSYVAEKYIPDIDSFDNFKAYLQQHNYHFYQDR